MTSHQAHTLDGAILSLVHAERHRRAASDARHSTTRCIRHLSCILLVGLVASCASVSDVPLPSTTQYDNNKKAHKAYLEGYREGYRAVLEGHAYAGPDVFSDDPIATARMFGWYDGSGAAAEVQFERDSAARKTRSR